MNFDLTEDQEMLKALAERFVSDRYDIDRRRAYVSSEQGFSSDNWSLLGELGLIAALFDETDGGFGLDATGMATIFEAMGRGLVVEPLIENVMVGARLFASGADESLREQWLPDLVSGRRRIAFAHVESRARPGTLWVEATAVANGSGYTLSGSKDYIPCGNGVDGYIVSARSNGRPAEPEGLGLYFVPADCPGLTITAWRMADGSSAASLSLVNVAGAIRLAGDASAIEEVQTRANLARCAEAVGIMERLFAETIEYLRTREQFGSRLADFQALQHRMAAQYASLEQCRALLNLVLVSEGTEGFAPAVLGARAQIGPASITLGHEMIQFHGGMGVTDELSIGHGHKRLLVLSRWPDDPETALDRFAGIA